ncbi:MAG: ABC transporter permease, partial [Bacteroidota bacterium]
MLQNNLKIAWRSIINNIGSSTLNIIGLTLGVLCSVIIFLTVKYELSFDTQHQNAAEIYRVTNNYYYPTFTMYVGQTPDPMYTALQNDFPSFTNVVPIHSSYNHNLSVGEALFESDIIYCGSEFVETFDFYDNPSQWIIGNPKEILQAVNKTVLTKTLAEKLFDRPQDAIGKIIRLQNDTEIEVAGVMLDPPNNTNYPFELLVSYPTFENFMRNTFGGVSSTTTFVQIPAAVNIDNLR